MRFFIPFLMMATLAFSAKLNLDEHGYVTTANNLKWGPIGHASVASIAQSLISANAQAAVLNLLPDYNGDMSAIASWADQVRSYSAYSWSGPLHFINSPDWACNYNYARDCKNENGDVNMCVDGAIHNYTKRLTDSSLSTDQTVEALKFLVHFVGDIHQPLHCGFIGDEGGNTYVGDFESWYSKKLHAVWDSYIIENRINNDFNGDQTQWVTYLVSQINSGTFTSNVTEWKNCGSDNSYMNACSGIWASESITLACQYAYVDESGNPIQSGFDLQDPYYNRVIPIVEAQIAKGGVRLANILNTIWP